MLRVKELIEKLQALDPDGEKEVIIASECGNIPNDVECYENYIQIY